MRNVRNEKTTKGGGTGKERNEKTRKRKEKEKEKRRGEWIGTDGIELNVPCLGTCWDRQVAFANPRSWNRIIQSILRTEISTKVEYVVISCTYIGRDSRPFGIGRLLKRKRKSSDQSSKSSYVKAGYTYHEAIECFFVVLKGLLLLLRYMYKEALRSQMLEKSNCIQFFYHVHHLLTQF